MLTRDEVLKISRLANLELTGKEIEAYQVQLGKILDYFQQLQAITIKDLDCAATRLSRGDCADAVMFREDKPVCFEAREKLMHNALTDGANHYLLPSILVAK